MVKRVCNICNEEKELYDFNMDNARKGGVSYGCKQCERERGRKYYIKNKEKRKEYEIKNKEKIKSRTKKYRINNKEKYNEYHRNRKLNNPIHKLSHDVRRRLGKYLKTTSITKNKKTFDIIGCSPPELKEHLEKQFVDGMSWDNRNEWHIDHIIPLSSANTEEEIYKLAHYSNLQPLWAEDNLKKGDRY